MKSRTLKNTVQLEGRGLFTGKDSKVRILPLTDKTGIFFSRTDIPGTQPVKIGPDNLLNGFRSSVVSSGPVEIKSVEHILSSLYGLNITSAAIEVEGEEIPAMDGCSKLFVNMLQQAGFKETHETLEVLSITEPVHIQEEDAFILAMPREKGLKITFTIDYPGTSIGQQTFNFELTPENYANEIAPARTFCTKQEAEEIQKKDMGKGATASNIIIIDETPASHLRFHDEWVRHKILDLIGDLSALGCHINAHIVAFKSGHSMNVQLVKKIYEHRAKAIKKASDSSATLDIREIQKYLPHRYPLLLVDRVIEIEGYNKIVGIKNVTINEPYFQGHFPGNPVMPGVLILEALAQLAGAMLIRKSENTKKLAVLISLDKVRLRKTVVPGDQLVLHAETIRLKARTCELHAWATVEGQLAADAEIKFMIIDSA